jgi:hypothetical protein
MMMKAGARWFLKPISTNLPKCKNNGVDAVTYE